jgi:hypothetical protein
MVSTPPVSGSARNATSSNGASNGDTPAPKDNADQQAGAWRVAAQKAQSPKPGVSRQPRTVEAPLPPSHAQGKPARHVEQSAGQISPKLLPIAKELREAFETQDLNKVLNAREELYRLLFSGAFEGEEKNEAKALVRLADGVWEKIKALSLIAANGEVDQKTFGTDSNKSKEAFDAREQYRKEAVAFILNLTIEQCARGALLAQCAKQCHGADAVFRWQVWLEQEFLFYVGKAGWVSIDQTKVPSGILCIVPRPQTDGLNLSGADILELDKVGKRSFDSKYLQARLAEAVELAPAVYLRHIAFIEDRPELRSEAMLDLHEMILPANWTATWDGNVGQRFAAMKKEAEGKLEEKIKAIAAQKLPAEKLQDALMNAEMEWAKDFAQRSYEFVKAERQAGRLQLSANGEKAFRELEGMYSGSDAKRAQINYWLDKASLEAILMAASAGVANIARAGIKMALERYIARTLGKEVLARAASKAGVYIAARIGEGYTLHGVMSGLNYLGGNKDAFANFWSEGLKSTVALIGMHGASKLAQSAIMGVAGRTLSNTERTTINRLLNSNQRREYLARVIQANGKLRALNQAGQLTAETLYFALQGRTEAVIGGQPLSSLLSPAEWAKALGQSALQVTGMKLGGHAIKPAIDALQSAQNHVAGNRVGTTGAVGTAADPVNSPFTVQVEDPLSGKIVTAKVPRGIEQWLLKYQNKRGVVGQKHIRESLSLDADGNVRSRVSQTGGKSFLSLFGNADGTYDLVPVIAGGSGEETPEGPLAPPAQEKPDGPGDAAALPPGELAERRAAWSALGFSDEWIKAHPEALAYDTGYITERINSLRALGFADPVTMVARVPGILYLSADNIRGKLDGLRGLGFTSPEAMITREPKIATLRVKEISDKILILQEAGFFDAVKLIEASPRMLTYSQARFSQVVGIAANFGDKSGAGIVTLIEKPQALIDAVGKASPKNRAELSAEIARWNAEKEAAAAKANEESPAGNVPAPASPAYPIGEPTRAERLEAELRELGFTDPMKLISSHPAVLNLAAGTTGEKLDALRSLGFTDPVKLVSRAPDILTFSTDNIRGKLDALRELGFADSVNLAASSPNLLYLAADGIGGRLDGLRNAGFANPVELVASTPSILGLATDNIRGKLDTLRELGFTDPVKVVTREPSILNLATDSIRGKLDGLRELGFTNPVELVASAPGILSLATGNIRGKLDGLRALGFADPVLLITRAPKTLTYATGAMGGKLDDLRNAGFNAMKIIEANPAILGFARARIRQVAGIVAKLDDGRDSNIFYLIKQRQTVINAVEEAAPKTWADARALIRRMKNAPGPNTRGEPQEPLPDLADQEAESPGNRAQQIAGYPVEHEREIWWRDASNWKKLSGHRYEGVYESPAGRQYDIKRPLNEDEVKNELLAVRLYAEAGVAVPSVAPVMINDSTSPNAPSKLAIARRIEGVEPGTLGRVEMEAAVKQVREDYAVHAWLSNLRVSRDNIVVGANRVPYLKDNSASLLLGPQGIPRLGLDPSAPEFEMYRDPRAFPEGASLFADLSMDELKAGVSKLSKISDQQIEAIVNKFGSEAGYPAKWERGRLVEILRSRRDSIIKQYNEQLKTFHDAEALQRSAPAGPKAPPPSVPGRGFLRGSQQASDIFEETFGSHISERDFAEKYFNNMWNSSIIFEASRSPSGPYLYFSGSLKQGEKTVGLITRTIWPEAKYAEHISLQIESDYQGKNIATGLMKNEVKIYRDMDFQYVSMKADRGGGYAWAKFGFLPSANDWKLLRSRIRNSLESKMNQMPQQLYFEVDSLLDSTDPRVVWRISDLEYRLPSGIPLGKALLSGLTWDAKLDLKDPQTMQRFDDYVARR